MNKRSQRVRASYLRAKRDYLRKASHDEAKLKKPSPKPEIVKVVDTLNTVCADGNCGLTCPSCGREFINKSGMLSHLRHKTCEKK